MVRALWFARLAALGSEQRKRRGRSVKKTPTDYTSSCWTIFRVHLNRSVNFFRRKYTSVEQGEAILSAELRGKAEAMRMKASLGDEESGGFKKGFRPKRVEPKCVSLLYSRVLRVGCRKTFLLLQGRPKHKVRKAGRPRRGRGL